MSYHLTNDNFKILFLSDTHLGFDYPLKPRVNRRRRGPDFFDSYHKALKPALDEKVDYVVHGGDMFFRSKVHPTIVEKAFKPLLQIADNGIPVLIVPGNHERGNIPASLLETHPNIFIFRKPTIFGFIRNSKSIGFCGFPYYYKGIREKIGSVLDETGYHKKKYDALFLCVHHLFTGSHVGAQHFVFKNGKDVISPESIPQKFDLVLSGHIHTAQKMMHDQHGKQLAVPIVYAGSTERTSFAERLEEKGSFILHVDMMEDKTKVKTVFRKHTTRPMYNVELFVDSVHSKEEFNTIVLSQLSCLESDSVVQIKVTGELEKSINPIMTDSHLRNLAPDTMNISFSRSGRWIDSKR